MEKLGFTTVASQKGIERTALPLKGRGFPSPSHPRKELKVYAHFYAFSYMNWVASQKGIESFSFFDSHVSPGIYVASQKGIESRGPLGLGNVFGLMSHPRKELKDEIIQLRDSLSQKSHPRKELKVAIAGREKCARSHQSHPRKELKVD